MIRISTVLSATALALALSAAAAIAQTPSTSSPGATTTKTAPVATKKAPAKKVSTTEAGKKCSADADAKGLHGKERSKFRSTCKREFNAANRSTSAPVSSTAPAKKN